MPEGDKFYKSSSLARMFNVSPSKMSGILCRSEFSKFRQGLDGWGRPIIIELNDESKALIRKALQKSEERHYGG